MSSSKIENVLVLQGGGSLGAFGCGVFKALATKNIKLDMVAGTSIGGITYTKMRRERGAEIKNIIHITRDEPFPYYYEDTAFSLETIRNSIKQGESKTNEILQKMQ
jgi:predicted patatin/cPLA2 family phospholipase